MFHVPAHKQQDQSKAPAQVPVTPIPAKKSWWHQVGHFYRPLRAYGGKVLKYAGIATVGNFQQAMDEWVHGSEREQYRDGFVLVASYMGDRIDAATRQPFNG